MNEHEILKVGDKVVNLRSHRFGIVNMITESGSIEVIESIEPLIINTHDSSKTLRKATTAECSKSDLCN